MFDDILLIIKNSLKKIQHSSLEFAFFVPQSLQLCNFKQMFQKYQKSTQKVT